MTPNCTSFGYNNLGAYHYSEDTIVVLCGQTQTVTQTTANTDSANLQGVDHVVFDIGIFASLALVVALVIGLITTVIKAWSSPTTEEVQELADKGDSEIYSTIYRVKDKLNAHVEDKKAHKGVR